MYTEIEKRVQQELFAIADEAYRDFQALLVPNIEKERILGVRPFCVDLRALLPRRTMRRRFALRFPTAIMMKIISMRFWWKRYGILMLWRRRSTAFSLMWITGRRATR